MRNGSETPAASPRPTGARQIHAAVIRAAARRFAAEGLRTSLRDIATDAGVNVGLIHRHIGNKDDVVRAVLASQSRVGANGIARAADIGGAFSWIFGQLASGRSYVRIIAWLLLGGGDSASWGYQRDYATIEALRNKAPDGADEIGLMAAMTLVYGWSLFSDRLMEAFGADPARRAEIDSRLAALATQLVTAGAS